MMETSRIKREDPQEREEKKMDVSRVQVGARLSIWWPGEKDYYDATVGKVDPSKSVRFFLEYDDGDEESVNLMVRKYKRIEDPQECEEKRMHVSRVQVGTRLSTKCVCCHPD